MCLAPSWSKICTPSVYLAGGIDVGDPHNWWNEMTAALSPLSVTMISPCRKDWDPSWKQRATNLWFNEQMKWELQRPEEADVIALHLRPGATCPTNLMELCLYAPSGKLVVCCPDGFSLKGHVEMVCDKYGIPLVETVEDFVATVKERLLQAELRSLEI